MKKSQLILGGIGLLGFGVGGYLMLNRPKAQAVPVQGAAGTNASDYTSGAYADWAAQQPAPVVKAEPIGIFKTAVEETMSFVKSFTDPRGIRNNNPLNIEWNALNNWVGLTGTDGRFCIFDTPENGIRAAAKILDSYAKRGINTIQKIIETWAPATENNVAAYVDSVCKSMGRTPGAVIIKASGDYVPLLAAMIKHENGKQPYTLAQIQKGVSLS
jgi:hypothetical protein